IRSSERRRNAVSTWNPTLSFKEKKKLMSEAWDKLDAEKEVEKQAEDQSGFTALAAAYKKNNLWYPVAYAEYEAEQARRGAASKAYREAKSKATEPTAEEKEKLDAWFAKNFPGMPHTKALCKGLTK